MDYYSFNRPRRDGRLSWPCWLTDSGRFTHKEVTRPAASLAQDRESTPAEPAVLTTMLRHNIVQSVVLRLHVIHLSVCPSVMLVDCDHIGWKSWKLISWPNSLRYCSVGIWSNGNTAKIRVEQGWPWVLSHGVLRIHRNTLSWAGSHRVINIVTFRINIRSMRCIRSA